MPQTLQVLKCYKCSIFQVHLAKKSNKWECKLCGEKQSIKRHYGIGTALECRGHVQKLNSMQGNKCDTVTQLELDSDDFEYIQKDRKQCYSKRKSKWSAFIDENDDKSDSDQQFDCNIDIPLQVAKKQKHEVLYKTEVNENEHVRSNSFNNMSQLQDSKMKSYKIRSAFISNDDIPVSSSSREQIPRKRCELYTGDDHEYTKKYIEKYYPKQDHNIKSNKWSAFVSDDESVNENWSKISQKLSDIKSTPLTKGMNQDEFIKVPKDTMMEHDESKCTQFGVIETTVDEATNLKKKNKICFLYAMKMTSIPY